MDVNCTSRSVRARGLKQVCREPDRGEWRVALRASAWIETLMKKEGWKRSLVALRASAWIETVSACLEDQKYRVAPSRARGLKQRRRLVLCNRGRVAPSRARGLKHPCPDRKSEKSKSRSVRACGLKRDTVKHPSGTEWSHLAQLRVLKLTCNLLPIPKIIYSSFTLLSSEDILI